MTAGQGETCVDAKAEPNLRPDSDDHRPISTMVTVCESNFTRSLTLMELDGETRYADILRQLRAKFNRWAAYLGVFDVENGTLDHRLKRHRYGDIVLLVLDRLNGILLHSKLKTVYFLESTGLPKC